MALEQAKKFVTRVLNDKAFKEKFTDASKEDRAKLIKDAGYEFTQEELIEARNQVFPGQMDELSSDQLDQVAGGGHCGHTHEGEGHCGFTHESEAANTAGKASITVGEVASE